MMKIRRHRWVPRVYKPGSYHGHGRRVPFFEGWYYKVVDKHRRERVVIIPGVYKSRSESYAFIQVLDGNRGKTEAKRYTLYDLRASRHRFQLVVGPNLFTPQLISLNILGDDFIKGELAFRQLKPWPIYWHSPGAMGPYAFVPLMECYHAVLSMDHEVDGSLIVGGREIDFTGGRGYLEKDWGRSFPQSWIWMQSNHFESTGTAFCASLAVIPWIRRSFGGIIAALLHEGVWHFFTTYRGARVIDMKLCDDHLMFVLRQKNKTLELLAERSQGHGMMAPGSDGVNRLVHESLDGEIQLRLSRKGGGQTRVLFEGIGSCAGVEIGGEREKIEPLLMGRKEEPDYGSLEEKS